MKLKPQHISTLVASLADFVRMADRKIIASTLSQLKLELDFDSAAISQLQVVLFGFQDAVSIAARCILDEPPRVGGPGRSSDLDIWKGAEEDVVFMLRNSDGARGSAAPCRSL